MKTIKSIGLFIIALLLSPLLFIGIIWSFFKLMIGMKFYQWWNRLGEYFFKTALSIDQLGNVMCQDLFNSLLIKDDSTPFGDEDETISSVLGKNLLKNNLTRTGKILDSILHLIDPNHSIKSIGN
jgi:8-oxo-dGTP diphosphatase